jgi:hypothetical protein
MENCGTLAMIVIKKSQVFKNSQPVFFPWVSAKMVSKADLRNFHEHISKTTPCQYGKTTGTYGIFPGVDHDRTETAREATVRQLSIGSDCLILKNDLGHLLSIGGDGR